MLVDTTSLYHHQVNAGIYPSTVTTILVPSDFTLMLPWLMLRLLAVSHHPLGILLPLSTPEAFFFETFLRPPHVSRKRRQLRLKFFRPVI